MVTRASRTQYFVAGPDHSLYRRHNGQLQVFARYTTGDWEPARPPARWVLRRIWRLDAWLRLWNQRRLYRRFERQTR